MARWLTDESPHWSFSFQRHTPAVWKCHPAVDFGVADLEAFLMDLHVNG
jgi:hypothetical protein